MTTKSIPKLVKSLTQNTLHKSKGILLKVFLGILVASLFLPVFVLNPRAAGAQEGGLTGTISPRGTTSSSLIKITDFKMSFAPVNGKGLRSKYRVLNNDPNMVFGSGGIDPVYVQWQDPSFSVDGNTQFELPAKDNNTGVYDRNPYFTGVGMAFSYAANVQDYQECTKGWVVNTCFDNVFVGGAVVGGKYGDGSSSKDGRLGDFNPTLKTAAWQNPSQLKTAGLPKGAIGSVEFAVVPVIAGNSSFITGTIISILPGSFYSNAAWIYLLLGTNAPKFTVEVFNNITDITAACKADLQGQDQATIDKCNNPEFAKYGFAGPVTQTTSSNEKADPGAVSNLYDLVRKVIAYIVLLITSFVYWIFSTVLVPVLVALLGIQAYKDNFVNFIYPGWVIMRNISNIVFIIALLYMGLKILFQQEDAAKSRGFIVTLILMALLVNFSLVVGQSIVGIADTVQAQFMPKDNKVIEALGQKLMVDPIKVFRGGDSSLASGGSFTTDAVASDLPNAIILLVLALAAFFSFIALAAFMFVRLVMLWILYMVSPLAYVGRILPETKAYANQWWTEFIRYSFNVAILSFFLNIAALMAVTFSAQSGDQVTTQGANGYLLGGVAADFTTFAVTVASHFIVLVFFFVGMQYAQKFGGVGSKQIVGFAKKGFNFMAKTVPTAAKNYASDKASTQLEKYGPKGQAAAKGLSALTHPKMFGAAVKKRWIDDPAAKRTAREARRIGDIKGLTRTSTTANALDNAKAAMKDFDSDASGYLQAKMREGDTSHNRAMSQGAMMSLAKNKRHDDIISGAESITGKKYAKNAAGLNAAVRDLAEKQSWTKQEEVQMMKNLDDTAAVDSKTAHYSGNTDYDESKKEWNIFDLNKQSDPSNTQGQQQLEPKAEAKNVQKLVGRRLSKGLVEDMKNHSIDSMVTKSGGNITGWNDTQIGVLGSRSLDRLSNRKEGEKFRATDNYEKLAEGYKKMGEGKGGSRAELERRLVTYNQTYNVGEGKTQWSQDEIRSKADAIHQNLMGGDLPNIRTSGASSPSGDSPNTGGGGSKKSTKIISESNPTTPNSNPVILDQSGTRSMRDRLAQDQSSNKQSNPSSQAQSSTETTSPPSTQRQPETKSDLIARRDSYQQELDQRTSSSDPRDATEIPKIQSEIDRLNKSIDEHGDE